jgi:hypothetical protein
MGSLLADLSLPPDQGMGGNEPLSISRRFHLNDSQPGGYASQAAAGVAVAAPAAGRLVHSQAPTVGPAQDAVARSTALDLAAMNRAASPPAHRPPATHPASSTQSIQSSSAAAGKANPVLAPTLQGVPLADLNLTTRVVDASHLARALPASSVDLTMQRGRTSSTPNFSRYAGVPADNRLDGITVAQDASGNPILAATGVVQVNPRKVIEVATIAPDGSAGASTFIDLTSIGLDATGVGISADQSGNLFISATLAPLGGGSSIGMGLIKIDPSGGVQAVVLTNNVGSAGYLRWDPNTASCSFRGASIPSRPVWRMCSTVRLIPTTGR